MKVYSSSRVTIFGMFMLRCVEATLSPVATSQELNGIVSESEDEQKPGVPAPEPSTNVDGEDVWYHPAQSRRAFQPEDGSVQVNPETLMTWGPHGNPEFKYNVNLYADFDCAKSPAVTFSSAVFMSSGCKPLEPWIRSFSLSGNVKDCNHYWYYDSDCSDPAEFSAVFGDVKCQKAPGAPGLEKLGSYKLVCPNGKHGWADNVNLNKIKAD